MATGPHSLLDAEVEPCSTHHYESFPQETTKAVNSLLSELSEPNRAMGITDNIPEPSFGTVNCPTAAGKRNNDVHADHNWYTELEDTVWRVTGLRINLSWDCRQLCVAADARRCLRHKP